VKLVQIEDLKSEPSSVQSVSLNFQIRILKNYEKIHLIKYDKKRTGKQLKNNIVGGDKK